MNLVFCVSGSGDRYLRMLRPASTWHLAISGNLSIQPLVRDPLGKYMSRSQGYKVGFRWSPWIMYSQSGTLLLSK
jgi:hypothetical protein